MLQSNKFNFIIAILSAICLWAYVVGELDPVATEVVRNVPITFTNQEYLGDSSLTILETEADSINIIFSGKKSDMRNIKAKDFKVVCDLGKVTYGENIVILSISAPSEVSIKNVSRNKILVKTDKYITANKNIKVIFQNAVDKNEPYITNVNKNQVKISGAKTYVDSVVRVNALLDISKLDETSKTLKCMLEPIDRFGKKVNVGMDFDSVYVTSMIANKTYQKDDIEGNDVTNINDGNDSDVIKEQAKEQTENDKTDDTNSEQKPNIKPENKPQKDEMQEELEDSQSEEKSDSKTDNREQEQEPNE